MKNPPHQILVRILGIRNQVAYVTHKDPGYINCEHNHIIRVPAGQTQVIDSKFLVTESSYNYKGLKAKFFA